jgi:hypothetical protein
MSHSHSTTLTHHAMLVAWGQFAQCIDLIAQIEAVELHQKAVDHPPNRKVLEFFVAILGGLPYLKDISPPIRWIRIKPWPKRGHRPVGQTIVV